MRMLRLGKVALAALGAVAMLPAEADSGDHIHPNDAGNQKMADAFDLGVFKP